MERPMKSFTEYINEGASVGPGSPWAKASRGKIKPSSKKKVKPSSVYDVGHYSDSDSMKKSDLYHIGSKTGHASITHHEHHKQSNARRRKAGWEGKVTPNNANHGTWKKTKQEPTEHFAQGRVDHIKKKYTVNGSNSKMETKARNRMAGEYPNYTEHIYESSLGFVKQQRMANPKASTNKLTKRLRRLKSMHMRNQVRAVQAGTRAFQSGTPKAATREKRRERHS